MEYIEVRGKTIEIAIALGLEELHLRDVSEARVEVLQQAERGFLGMGGRDAVVRLTRNQDVEGRGRRRGGRGRGQEAGSGADRSSGEPRGEPRSRGAASTGGTRSGRGGAGAGGEGRPAPRAQSNAGGRASPSGGRAGNRTSPQSRPQVRAEAPPAEAANVGPAETGEGGREARPPRTNGDSGDARPRRRRGGRGRGGAGGGGERGPGRPGRPEEGDDGPPHSAEYGEGLEEKAEVAHEFITGLLASFDLQATVMASGNEDAAAVEVTVEGDGASLQVLVGRQGTVLQAIQDLTRTVVQRRMQSATRIRLDVGGYRERRKAKLEVFAHEQAMLALESGREIELDPMSSPDRKVVHDAIAAIDGIETYSEGEEPDRYVVLTPTGPARPADAGPTGVAADVGDAEDVADAGAEASRADAEDEADEQEPEDD